ncbi:hypothetical protein GCM10011371_14340 [Novosphingobium marinum]|uniref:Uncharacterized protein n=1 Tax=Novosphingobium marinum TaxID=1514948 RepID=A0A7Y9XVZ1_9SPHN|nr:hypothetical protein [Novosphingobium marinum]NYH95547.1 hypothetical protein [Novosphingobium marinum]GGC27933.1 hypothetical protein GCM10011371_14340 [Novosphingobium marinum]
MSIFCRPAAAALVWAAVILLIALGSQSGLVTRDAAQLLVITTPAIAVVAMNRGNVSCVQTRRMA